MTGEKDCYGFSMYTFKLLENKQSLFSIAHIYKIVRSIWKSRWSFSMCKIWTMHPLSILTFHNFKMITTRTKTKNMLWNEIWEWWKWFGIFTFKCYRQVVCGICCFESTFQIGQSIEWRSVAKLSYALKISI